MPFCSALCPFCPYNKVVPRPGEPQRYFAALSREVARFIADGTPSFTSLYVGGGTPTLFPDLLAPVLEQLATTGERAIEVLPTHGTPRRLDHLVDLGFDAVSIGAQSFDDGVLTHLGRRHSAKAGLDAITAATARFPLVDVDLILDVEYDDRHAGSFLRDLERCFEAGVQQVSTYPLMRFGYTPFGAARHARRREHAVLDQAEAVAARHGYERRSVWTFNRLDAPTYSSITRRRFVGFGAGASSFVGSDFLVNHFGLDQYLDAVAAGRAPVARRLHLGPVLGRAYEGFWQAYTGTLPSWLSPVQVLGWARRDGGPDAPLRLTSRGYRRYHDLERLVTYAMIEPLWGEMLREHGVDPDRDWTRGRRRVHLPWAVLARFLERSVPDALHTLAATPGPTGGPTRSGAWQA